MDSRRRWIFPVLVPLFTFGFLFLLLEVGLRVLGIGYAYSRVIPDPVLHHVHPPLFSYITHNPNTEIEGHRVVFDAEGRIVDPQRPDATDSLGADTKRIVFLGDSFVEALQVPYRDSFVGRLAASVSPGTVVLNYGVSSYSPILYLLQWRKEVREQHPSYVFLLLYGNDVRDDARYGRLARRDEAGNVVAVPGPEMTWWRKLMRHSYTLRLFRKYEMVWERRLESGERDDQAVVGGAVEENPDLSPATRGYLEALRDEVAASGAQLVVMAVPSKYALRNGSLPDGEETFAAKVARWANEAGVRYVDLVGPFEAARPDVGKLFFDEDIHFNRAGHEVVAATLQKDFPQLFGGPVP